MYHLISHCHKNKRLQYLLLCLIYKVNFITYVCMFRKNILYIMFDTTHSFRPSLKFEVFRDKAGSTLIFFTKYYHPILLFVSIEEIKEGKINDIKYQETSQRN